MGQPLLIKSIFPSTDTVANVAINTVLMICFGLSGALVGLVAVDRLHRTTLQLSGLVLCAASMLLIAVIPGLIHTVIAFAAVFGLPLFLRPELCADPTRRGVLSHRRAQHETRVVVMPGQGGRFPRQPTAMASHKSLKPMKSSSNTRDSPRPGFRVDPTLTMMLKKCHQVSSELPSGMIVASTNAVTLRFCINDFRVLVFPRARVIRRKHAKTTGSRPRSQIENVRSTGIPGC
ncbi:hypothetical protein [Mycobacterium tilburgii]|uniref:hypothetical protein n=1 Tax=Mycobacterium tilburgii TaxID=44467 RepID=UPI001181EEE6|nr:hypothetical protein [Mycobacterium tilburgii]